MRLALGLLLALAAPAAAAQDTVVYRCTSATGAVTIQNGTACPKGSRQEKRIVEAPTILPAFTPPPAIVTQATSAPAPTPTPAPIAPAASLSTVAAPPAPAPTPDRPQAPAAAAIADADRLPPPPLFQCHTWDNDHYLSEDGAPKPRCVLLQTTDLSGDPNAGAGQACEMKTDSCDRVPDGAACDGWKQRQREVESTWRYAKAADKQQWQDEFARITRILGESICGK